MSYRSNTEELDDVALTNHALVPKLKLEDLTVTGAVTQELQDTERLRVLLQLDDAGVALTADAKALIREYRRRPVV